MLILLMICGFIMAFSINLFYTVNKLPYERYLEVSENYIELKHPQLDHVITSNETIYEDVRQWFQQIVQTQVYYLSSSNAYATAKFHIRGTSDEPFYRASIEYVGQFKDYDVIYGNYPEKTNEILVSSGLYQTNQFGSFNYNNIGIWSLKDFVGETIVVGHGQDIKEYHIVGIVDAMTKSIYVQSLYSLIEFTEGSPLSFSEDEDPYLEEQFIYHHLTTSSHSLRVYTENKYDMIQVFLDAGFNVTDLSHKAKSMHQSDVAHYYQTSFITSVMFILFGLATFYFIMHTSIKNRVDEIAFYRLLGIRRSILVFGSLIEIIVITTISSVVGYLLMTYISFEISRSPLNQSVYFNIDAQIISLGIISIYIINLVAGLFPVIQLLNKIPIKLLSSNST